MFAYPHRLPTPSSVPTLHITGIGHAREWQASGQVQADNVDRVKFRLGDGIVWVKVEGPTPSRISYKAVLLLISDFIFYFLSILTVCVTEKVPTILANCK